MPPSKTRTQSATNRSSGIGSNPTEKSTDKRLDEISMILRTLVTEDILDAKLEKLKIEIQREHAERIELLENRVSDLEDENTDLRLTVSKLEEQCEKVKEKHSEMIGKYNGLEQQGRKNSLRIVGIQDENMKETVEDCVRSVVTFVRDTLKVPVQERDIDIAHRLGKFSASKSRNIIVKFTHRWKKQEILRARKKLKGTNFVVFEDLTRLNQQILKDAYRMNCVKNSYSSDGKLFVVLTNGKRRRLMFDTPLEESFLLNDDNFRI
ncbi:rab11 family-interacting protein 4B-like [Ylistrum balloti]|uniref:rab11 family-interacting protein 4B-like n=1 Tax=Ylistrum balloti TaxID=509963 RepID=UPI0029059C48|nr:rab11 family-interacting protein 4B-like [Ylistrum balloti]